MMNSVNKDIKYLSGCSFGQTKHKINENSEDVCSICHEPMDEPLVTPCNHNFHRTCLCQWLTNKVTCPVCRRPFSYEEIVIMCPSVPRPVPRKRLIYDQLENPAERERLEIRPAVRIEW